MTTQKFNTLISQIEDAMEDVYVAQANYDREHSEDIYFLAEEAVDAGIGAVYVPTSCGRMSWLCLETLQF